MNDLKFKVRTLSLPFISLLLCSLFLNACSSGDDPLSEEPPVLPEEPAVPDEEEQPSSQTVKVVKMSASDFLSDNGNSRTSFTVGDSGLKFAWAEGDEIGVYPTAGTQIAFTIKSGAGQNTAYFDGGAWALRDTETYASYYPYDVDNAARSNAEIRFSYEGQTQTGNASLAHLGAHDLMATNATNAVNGELVFQFKHVNCAAQMNLTVPVATSFKTLTLRCDEEIFAKVANLDLSGSEYIYSIYEPANQMVLSLTDIASTEANQTLTFYMMLPPVDMAGKTIHVILRDKDNKVYQGQLEPRTLTQGKAYRFSATLKDVTMSTEFNSPGFGNSDTQI